MNTISPEEMPRAVHADGAAVNVNVQGVIASISGHLEMGV